MFFRIFLCCFLAANILPAKPLTLSEAVKATLEAHPDAKAALLRLEEAQADMDTSRADFLPSITLNGEFFPQRTVTTQANGAFGARELSTTHIDTTLAYTVWDFGKSKNRFDSTAYAKESSKYASENVQYVLVERVWQAFYLVAYYDRLALSYRHTVEFYEALHKQATEMRKNGLKTQADEERFFASSLEAKDALVNAENESKKALLNLALLTGLAPDTVQIVDDFDNSSALKVDVKSDNEWRKELLANNKELKLLDAKIKQADSLSQAYRAEDYGSITAIASAARDNSLSYYNSSQVGLRASIPLYTGGKLSAQKEKARVLALEVKQEFYSKELLLWQELYAAITDAKSVDQTIKAKSAIMESAAKTVEIASSRYKEGLASYIDVLESKAAYENAQNGKNSAILKKIATVAKIKRLISKEDVADDTSKR
jgi:outer membrane protein TolC